MKTAIVRKDSYYDSVFLMQISAELQAQPGVDEAVVAMGTDVNRELIADMGLSDPEVAAAGPMDLVIALDANAQADIESAVERLDGLLKSKSAPAGTSDYRPGSFPAAHNYLPDANLAIVSLPGRFAAREARRALDAGLHVMLFSDNVSLEDEVSLKKRALEKGLLMMGPDCGTAIINGLPLCFANVVPRGPIGIVAASGTGLQEVSCAIAKGGSGVSQALGTGGRDIKEEAVGGMMMISCIDALGADPDTKVIVIISKPPKESLMPRVIKAAKDTGKPVVIHFVGTSADNGPAAATGSRTADNGGSPSAASDSPSADGDAPDEGAANSGGVHFASNLTEAARAAVSLAKGAPVPEATDFDLPREEIDRIVESEASGLAAHQKYLRGLFTGGTLTDEAVAVLHGPLGGVYSFDAKDPSFKPADPQVSTGHTVVDLGEDVFTVGRPHPMIDPSIRVERIAKEADDKEMAVLLLDCVIGYGSHHDPAGAMLESITRAKKKAAEGGGYLPVIASVTGTEGDPQGLAGQQAKLAGAGCVVMPTNYQAARLAALIMAKIAAGPGTTGSGTAGSTAMGSGTTDSGTEDAGAANSTTNDREGRS